MAVSRDRPKPPPPLDAAAFERLAIRYVERYATTRAKLARYLNGKIRMRGWDGAEAADIAGLVTKITALGYVDDKAFAEARGAALGRRGYGERRVGADLRAAGIDDEDARDANDAAAAGGWDAALVFARRKRIGPFGQAVLDRPAREKALAAMLRAGHRLDHARAIVASAPGEPPAAPD